jgi:CBS domain-containing protein
MQVQEIMTRGAEVIDPNTTIRDAARKMRADNIGALPVGENDRLIGTVTDRDIVVRAVAENRSAGNTAVREVSVPKIRVCNNDDEVH